MFARIIFPFLNLFDLL
jgi:hypothetical protein